MLLLPVCCRCQYVVAVAVAVDVLLLSFSHSCLRCSIYRTKVAFGITYFWHQTFTTCLSTGTCILQASMHIITICVHEVIPACLMRVALSGGLCRLTVCLSSVSLSLWCNAFLTLCPLTLSVSLYVTHGKMVNTVHSRW